MNSTKGQPSVQSGDSTSLDRAIADMEMLDLARKYDGRRRLQAQQEREMKEMWDNSQAKPKLPTPKGR